MTQLCELCQVAGFDLLRDAEVFSPGFLDVELPRRLVFVESERFAAVANTTPSISAVLVSPALRSFDWNDAVGIAVAPDPGRAFVDLHNHLARRTAFYGVRLESRIDPGATIHPKAHVDELDVVIGEGCRIDPGAVILEGSRLAANVHVMAGAVVGGSGFQTMRLDSSMVDFDHAGCVEVAQGTTVMANAVIARAVFKQATRIGEDCRIGNGAFVSHNCQIGAHGLVGHGAVIAGNTEIGVDVVIGPGATCVNNISIGDGARVTMGSVVTQSVAPGQHVTGNFAIDHRTFIRALKETVRSRGG